MRIRNNTRRDTRYCCTGHNHRRKPKCKAHPRKMSRSTFGTVLQLRMKSKYALAQDLQDLLQKNLLRHRHHPGIVVPRNPDPPKWISDTIQTLVKGYALPTKRIRTNARVLAKHLHGRHQPHEEEEIQEKIETSKARLALDVGESNDAAPDSLRSKRAEKLLKQLLYNWRPVCYDESTSLAYLVGRAIPNYTVLYKIFQEMKNREPSFQPYTLLDFGSGVGTVLWAADDVWGNSLREHVCIDVSHQMHDLADRFLHKGNRRIKRVFYRQHVPASPVPKYDVVTSAYSLFELPNATARLALLANLWDKTDRYLVLVEEGTNAGFKILNEARDFILQYGASGPQDGQAARVSAPCPHNLPCPRYTNDSTPCNFSTSYLPHPIFTPSRTQNELYSYVVLRKGTIPTPDNHWPRIVRPVLKRSRQVICRMCTNRGQLEEEIFTTWRSGRDAYRCARSSIWGDRLPVTLEDRTAHPNEIPQHQTKPLGDTTEPAAPRQQEQEKEDNLAR